MNLIVVESPTKARTLSRFLGSRYCVEATMGHIKDLPKNKLGVDIENNFAPEYLVIKGRNKEINQLKRAAKKANQIYLATDPDREGEAIASHVAYVLSDRTVDTFIHRIVFHEITDSAVRKAIKHPRGIDQNLVDAQIARRVLDRLVGYKLSPVLWRKIRRGLSAGRVQSVAVRLIVEREREIEAFVPEEFWEVWVELQTSKKPKRQFAVKLIKIDGKKAEVRNKKQADEIVGNLEKSVYKVFDVKKREVKKSPYPPFTTSTLTQTAARFFGWSARRTMSIAQRLYEEGLITYHRTDSTNIAKSAVSSVRSFIEKEYGSKYLPAKPRFYKTKSKVAQEAHEAIRPTRVNMLNVKSKVSKVNGAERLYELIWRRFVACQMADSLYDETKIDVLAEVNEGPTIRYLLITRGQVMKFDGWRKVIPPSKKEESQLPDVEVNDPLQLIKVDPLQKFTEPPPRYGEASLVKTLEKLGIGRPSTYAPIISTIQVRQYVEKKEGKFYPTPVGITVNDFLVKNFPGIFDYEFTARMEDDLDNVANGKVEWVSMMKNFYSPFGERLSDVEEKSKRVKIETEKLGKKCPTCEKEGRKDAKQGELVVRVGRFGKFVSCSLFPECKHTEGYIEKIGMKCPKCGKGEVIVKQTKKGRKFYGCSRYPKCDWASWNKPKRVSQ